MIQGIVSGLLCDVHKKRAYIIGNPPGNCGFSLKFYNCLWHIDFENGRLYNEYRF